MTRFSPSEIIFFKREGYLIKRGAMDPKLMERARERMWVGVPPRFKRGDPDSWIGPFREDEKTDDGNNLRRGYSWKYREPGSEDWIIEMLVTNSPMWDWAEQLLGEGEVVHPCHARPGQGAPEPDRIRGIYGILPEGDIPEQRPVGHGDGGFFHLGIVGLIDHVAPRGGAFTVWPKSHRILYYAYNSQYHYEHAEGYDEKIALINRQPYVDCHGGPGDIVFWHHRLAHTAGHNRSREIRKAVLYDFRKKNIDKTADEPPQEEMWRDWSEEVRAAPI